MKKGFKYFIVIVLFIFIMGVIITYYINERNNRRLISSAKVLLEDLYELEEGEYKYSNGNINGLDKYYFDGDGVVNVDKYGNVKFYITSVNKCVYKTYMGNIKVENSCPSEKEIKVSINRNNKIVSFDSDIPNLDYKVSSEDDFKGVWYSTKSENVVLSSYSSGDNYIWFKDKDGNLSEPYKFSVDCFDSNGLEYDSSLFYCTGSVVKLDDMYWLVLSSKKDENVLMMKDNFDDRFAMCDKKQSDFCYYEKDSVSHYRWENSMVHDYLNNNFINKLSDNTRSLLKDNYICNDYSYNGCKGEGCAGYIKEYIDKEGFSCFDYSKSKVRIITYEEYNRVFKYSKNLDYFSGNYWILNSYKEDTVGAVEEVGNVFMYENPTNKRDVRPVITLNK